MDGYVYVYRGGCHDGEIIERETSLPDRAHVGSADPTGYVPDETSDTEERYLVVGEVEFLTDGRVARVLTIWLLE
jgi:hypothetical protein